MNLAKRNQKFQDWFTQQWAIFWGKKIDPDNSLWLMGPFGQVGGIADNFIDRLAVKEHLIINRNTTSAGLLPDFSKLNLSKDSSNRISKSVIDFYENTANYDLNLSVKWNPFFWIFGKLTNTLFSNRIKQLNIPLSNIVGSNLVKSEIITLTDPTSGTIKYTIWYRTLLSTGQVVYSGIYSTCEMPSGQICIKAVFPLPHGNATVILTPNIGPDGALQLISTGKKHGEPGFYFLLNDSKNQYFAQYIRSFRDQLTVYSNQDKIFAKQILTLWNWPVVQFNYEINRKNNNHF